MRLTAAVSRPTLWGQRYMSAPAADVRDTPTVVENAKLFERYQRKRRPEDAEALVQRFLPLARHLARRYRADNEREDLDQVAALSLIKAIDRYDPSRGIAFSSFAVPTILGELRRYFRDRGWMVRVPRALQELSRNWTTPRRR